MKADRGDALLVADVQEDFLPGGRLAVSEGDAVIEPLNRCLELFAARGLPVFLSRDWHPPDHCSFRERGGPWPSHCVAGSEGARFSPRLRAPAGAIVISKATERDREAYSAFDGTGLEERLRALGVGRLFIGGLTTEYCVRATALAALDRGFSVCVIRDGVRAIEHRTGRAAMELLSALGARLVASPAPAVAPR